MVMRVPSQLLLLVICESHFSYVRMLDHCIQSLYVRTYVFVCSAGNDPMSANNEYTYSIAVQASVSPAVTG